MGRAVLNTWQSAKRCLAVLRPVPNERQEVGTANCVQAQRSDMDTPVGTSLRGLGSHPPASQTRISHMLARMCGPQRCISRRDSAD